MTIRLWYGPLKKARDAWRDRSDDLDGPRKNLAQADETLLGSRVAPAAQAFLTTWEQRIKTLHDRAEGHSDALDATLKEFVQTDSQQVERVQQLLMWPDRETQPVSTVGP